MQLIVTFEADHITLPIAASETIQGLIYRALSADLAYSTFVHEKGNMSEGRAFKLFNFSELKGRYEICGKEITYLSEVRLEIRSIDEHLMLLLFDFLMQNPLVRLGNNTVAVKDIRLRDMHIYADHIAIRTLSPITVYMTCEDRHTVYFSPEEERFYNAVIVNAHRKWLSCSDSDEGFYFSIRPMEGTGFIRRATRFKSTFITAWHGEFLLEGTPWALDFLYQTGLGSKNSQGFGMFGLL